MPTSRATLRDIVDRIHTIPTLSEVAQEVNKLLSDPNAVAADIERIVRRDPSMAAKMLRMVNSPLYSLASTVTDLEQAVKIIGFKSVRSIAMSVSVIDLSKQDVGGFSMKAFWAHGMVCAALCRLIAERAMMADPELAFIIGLLKDMGKLVLADNAPEELRAIIAVAKGHGLSFGMAAREVLETDDAEIAAWLCTNWQLPKEMIEPVGLQYEMILKPDMHLVAMIQLAEYLCALKNLRVSGDCNKPQVNKQVTKVLGLSGDDLRAIIEATDAEAAKAKEMLALMSG